MLKHNDKQRNLDKCMQKSKIVLAGVAVVPLHLVFGSSVGCKGAKGAKGKRQLWTNGLVVCQGNSNTKYVYINIIL